MHYKPRRTASWLYDIMAAAPFCDGLSDERLDEVVNAMAPLRCGDGFALAHQSATRAIEDRAQAARSKRKIDKVLNPEAEARKKLRRSQKKTAYRKKKLEEVKRKRGSGR